MGITEKISHNITECNSIIITITSSSMSNSSFDPDWVPSASCRQYTHQQFSMPISETPLWISEV